MHLEHYCGIVMHTTSACWACIDCCVQVQESLKKLFGQTQDLHSQRHCRVVNDSDTPMMQVHNHRIMWIESFDLRQLPVNYEGILLIMLKENNSFMLTLIHCFKRPFQWYARYMQCQYTYCGELQTGVNHGVSVSHFRP